MRYSKESPSHCYWLWQTGLISPKGPSRDTILKQCTWSYMGSAEYEFGAIPNALYRYLIDPVPKVYGKIEIEWHGYQGLNPITEPILVRYWVREDQEELLRNALLNYKDTTQELKESPSSMLSNNNSVVFCLDEGYECFIWRKKTFRSQIEEHMNHSLELLTITRKLKG